MKKNDSEWTNWDRYINVKAGDRVYFKGNNCITIEDEFDIMMDTDDIIDFSSYEKGKEILAKDDYGVEL